ncbi:hypothetical protein V6N13_009564 [Hibiscus sabdariffa]
MGVSLLSSLPAFLVFFSFLTFCLLADPVLGITRHYKFDVKLHNVTRLCHTRSIVSVNGQFPGPRIVAREGDQLLIKVVNHVPNNISIHWHGIRQLRREWFNSDPEAVISQALQTGGGPNVSDAYTINGLPGPLYNCSAKGQGTFDNSTVAGILEYESVPNSLHSSVSIKMLPLFKPILPALNDTSFATNFASKLRSLANVQYPANVPRKVDKHFFFTVGLGTSPCQHNQTCQGPNGTKFAASVNNVSFEMPTTALLQAHFFSQSNGVYTPDFPSSPIIPFNYTGTPPNNTMVSNGTKVVVLPFNTSVELVMQDTSILGAESHPLHLHGFNFFVVGQGFGNFDPNKDPAKFNLIDPVERNTIGVPSGGWVAIRFVADNPGVWFMHCHLEVHTSWGLKMAWIVLDGELPNQKLPPPPADLPKC